MEPDPLGAFCVSALVVLAAVVLTTFTSWYSLIWSASAGALIVIVMVAAASRRVSGHPRHDVDPAFQTPLRLSLMAALGHRKEVDFGTFRDLMEATVGEDRKVSATLA